MFDFLGGRFINVLMYFAECFLFLFRVRFYRKYSEMLVSLTLHCVESESELITT